VTGFEAAELSSSISAANVKGASGQSFSGPYLCAADGLWSMARRFVAPEARPLFSGATASRSLLPTRNLEAPFDAPVVTLWLGTRAHLVTYPVKAGKALNVVLVTEGGSPHQGWDHVSDRTALLAQTADWARPAHDLIRRIDDWRSWSLFRLPPLPHWSKGNIVLLGDAAHPVLPFLAQGAGLAIEDAVTLADTLSTCGKDHRFAFAEYERLRRSRALRVQQESIRLGRIYHLSQPWSSMRNLVLANRAPERAISAFDWLYGA